MTIVKLLGHEIELAPLRGRKGAAHMHVFQIAWDDLLSAMQSVVNLETAITETGFVLPDVLSNIKVLRALSAVVSSEKFLEDTLPLFWMCSTEPITKAQALKIIDDSPIETQTPADILSAIFAAMDFWGPGAEEKAAFEEAAKKLSGDDAVEK